MVYQRKEQTRADQAASRISPAKQAFLAEDKVRFRQWYSDLLAQPFRKGRSQFGVRMPRKTDA